LKGMAQGYEARRKRQQEQITNRAQIIRDEVTDADAKMIAISKGQNAYTMGADGKAIATPELLAAQAKSKEAHDKWDKMTTEIEKFYQPDKTIWGKVKGYLLQPRGAQGGQRPQIVPNTGARPAPLGTPSTAPPPASLGPDVNTAYASAMSYPGYAQGLKEQVDLAKTRADLANQPLQNQITRGDLEAQLGRQQQSVQQQDARQRLAQLGPAVRSGAMADLNSAVSQAMTLARVAFPEDPEAGNKAALGILQVASLSGKYAPEQLSSAQQSIYMGIQTKGAMPANERQALLAAGGVPQDMMGQPPEVIAAAQAAARQAQQDIHRGRQTSADYRATATEKLRILIAEAKGKGAGKTPAQMRADASYWRWASGQIAAFSRTAIGGQIDPELFESNAQEFLNNLPAGWVHQRQGQKATEWLREHASTAANAPPPADTTPEPGVGGLINQVPIQR
jgi:hypothetical protein